MNKSIASTQGQKNKRYSVKKPSIAHFFVSQSRLTDAVSVIFGELLSYEHPPNCGDSLVRKVSIETCSQESRHFSDERFKMEMAGPIDLSVVT